VAKAEASGNVSQTVRELGISNKSLHGWKQYGEPLDIDKASVQELSARVCQLAMRDRQIEVLKKAIGIVWQYPDFVECKSVSCGA
jgi:hypothetical protein